MSKYAIIKSFLTSDPWISFRLTLIAERGNKCEKCGRIIARSIDIIGHHKIELTPENVSDYSISLNPDNVMLVCFGCHNVIHNRFGMAPSRSVYIVYGPPLAGKKSFVWQQMTRGDIVVDMDRLYHALTMLPVYDKPDNLLFVVKGVYSQLLDNIKTRYGKWSNAWVVGGYADKRSREKLADDLGAELVFCNVSQDECLRRLYMDDDIRFRRAEWEGYIQKWFDTYRE